MLQSVFLRISILGFSFWIINHSENAISEWAYYVVMLLYFTVYVLLKKYKKDVIRLWWDFLFINSVLWGKSIEQPIPFLIIFLPLINAINFSGAVSHLYQLVLLTGVTIYIHMSPSESGDFLPFAPLIMMYCFARCRYREWEVEESVTQEVNRYFLDSEVLKPYQIYKNIINTINKYIKFNGNSGIRLIMTYTLKDCTLWLIDASEFQWSRMLKLTEQEVYTLKQNGMSQRSYSSDSIMLMYYVKFSEIEYVFSCVLPNDSMNLFRRRFFNRIMRLTFSKISTLLVNEYRISQRREKKLNEIKDNVLYVNQAVNAMHYIRNKLTPLKNLVAYHKFSEQIPSNARNEMESRLKKEVLQAEKDLDEIIYFASYLLDESENPDIGNSEEEISVNKMYVILSEIVENYLEKEVNLDSIIKDDALKDFTISVNLIKYKIMLTDWINNMKKYSKGSELVSMSVEDKYLVIHFENEYLISNEQNISSLIKDLNSTGKDAVIQGTDKKKKGYGIHNIKNIARNLGICIDAKKTIKNQCNLLSLEFKFDMHEKENSHI